MNAVTLNGPQGGGQPAKSKPVDWTPANFDMRDTWFPVAHSRDVTERTLRRMIHSQPHYLWRENGAVRASESRLGDPARLRREASAFTGGSGYYPVAECYGYVWTWYGNPDNADQALIPHLPFLPRTGGLPDYMRRTVRFDCSSALSVENLIDLTHADFLHAREMGDNISERDEVAVEWTSETVTRIRTVAQKSAAPIMRWVGGIRAKYQDVRSVLHVHLRSNVTISYPRYRPGFDVPSVQPFVPVGRNRSRMDVAFNTTAAPSPFRQIMPRIAYLIQPEDNLMVRPQNPRYAEPAEQRDLHSRFDTPGNRYRFQMQQLMERQQRGDFSYSPDAEPGRDITTLLGMTPS